jgi:K+ transporter
VIAARALGVLSMIFWSLFIVIVLKYIVLILRSTTRGKAG